MDDRRISAEVLIKGFEQADPDYSRKHSRIWGYFRVRVRPIRVPLCFLSLIAASIATTPWLRQIPYRFSLRTLLIAMTLIAVGLGLAVYANRN